MPTLIMVLCKPDHAVLNHGRGYARIRTYYRFAALGVLVSFAFSHPSSVQATRGGGVWIMSGLFACLCAHLCSASLCFSCFIGSQVCASISIALLFVVIFSLICWLPDTVYAGSVHETCVIAYRISDNLISISMALYLTSCVRS